MANDVTAGRMARCEPVRPVLKIEVLLTFLQLCLHFAKVIVKDSVIEKYWIFAGWASQQPNFMEKDVERLELIKEARELDLKNKLSNEQRMRERVELLNKYNALKDNAQKILGAVADLKNTTTAKLYKKMKLNPE